MQYIITLLLAALLSTQVFASSDKLFVGYFESWAEHWVAESNVKDSLLVQTPAYVNIVQLSFMQPDAKYVAGSYEVSGTGLQFPYDGKTLKLVIDKFKQTHPQSKILVAVGGATYLNWDKVNMPAIAAFIKDYGLDGADIDFEPNAGCSRGTDQHMHCQSDQQYVQLVKQFRAALPRPLWLTTAGWSIGAYGDDQWQNAQPQGDHTGMMLAVMRETADALDAINIMAYDAGNITSTGYNPVQALEAYQHYFKGKITLGIEVAPEAWGGNMITLAEAKNLANAVNQHNAAGMMLWSLQKRPNGTPSPQNPDAKMLGETVCTELGLGECK